MRDQVQLISVGKASELECKELIRVLFSSFEEWYETEKQEGINEKDKM